MKTAIVTILLTVLTTGTLRAEEQDLNHTFTDTKGNEIRAQITDIDIAGRKVQLLREKDGAEAWVGVDALSSEDLNYIEAWYTSSQLLSADKLLVSVQPVNTTTSTTKTDDGVIRSTNHYSELKVLNYAEVPIDNLRIDYCYYIGSAGEETLTASALKRVEKGTLTIGSLAKGESITLDTHTVALNATYEQVVSQSVFGSSSSEELRDAEEILGITFTVYGSGATQIVASRTFSTPEALIAWTQTLSQIAQN